MNIDWSGMVTAEQKAEQARKETVQAIAARRYEAEISGIEIGGLPIDSGRDSQALITGAALNAVIDPGYVCNWKTPGGFVQLDAQTLLGIAVTLRSHVQSCFDREAELLQALADGTYLPEMLEEGWPA